MEPEFTVKTEEMDDSATCIPVTSYELQPPSQDESSNVSSLVPIQHETQVKIEAMDTFCQETASCTMVTPQSIKEEKPFVISSYCSLANDKSSENNSNLQIPNLSEQEDSIDGHCSTFPETKSEIRTCVGNNVTSFTDNVERKDDTDKCLIVKAETGEICEVIDMSKESTSQLELISMEEDSRKPLKCKKPLRFCVLCKTVVKNAKLKRHITRNHKTNEEVRKILKASIVEQNQFFDLKKREGILEYNIKEIGEGKDAVMRERKPKTADSLRFCADCKKFLSCRSFSRHKCESNHPQPIKPKLLEKANTKLCNDTELQAILNRFRDGEIDALDKSIAQKDQDDNDYEWDDESIIQEDDEEDEEEKEERFHLKRPKERIERVKWFHEDTNKLKEQFNAYIFSNQVSKTNKGKLPSKSSIITFIKDNQLRSIQHLSQSQQYKKIRAKVFNERKTMRQKTGSAFTKHKACRVGKRGH